MSSHLMKVVAPVAAICADLRMLTLKPISSPPTTPSMTNLANRLAFEFVHDSPYHPSVRLQHVVCGPE